MFNFVQVSIDCDFKNEIYFGVIEYIYYKVYNKMPVCIKDNERFKYMPEITVDAFDRGAIEINNAVEIDAHYVPINANATVKNIIKYAQDNKDKGVCSFLHHNFMFVMKDEMLIVCYHLNGANYDNNRKILCRVPEAFALCPVEEIAKYEDIFRNMIVYELRDSTNTVKYGLISQGHSGYYIREMYANKMETLDLSANYNDDFPHQQIVNALNIKNKSGVVILHGTPGTGKSTYLRYLMSSMPDKAFIIMQPHLLNALEDESLINTLLDCKDAVIIFEDSESLLKKRDDGNHLMNTLLNLSDGIIGDSFNFKFIFTFNTDKKKNVDPALLRDGRLLFEYEFKPLAKDKAQKLLDNVIKDNDIRLESDTTVAKIFNYAIETSIEGQDTCGFTKSKRIGF